MAGEELERLLVRSATADEAFTAQPDTSHADARVEAWTLVVAAQPSPDLLNELGNALLSRYDVSAQPADLAQARDLYRRVVELTGQADSGYLNNLGHALHLSYQESGQPDLLDQAIDVLTQAATPGPPDPIELSTCVDNLARCLTDRFDLHGRLVDLERAISSYEWAVRLTGEDAPERGWHLATLGDLYIERYRQMGDPAALDAAVHAASAAVATTDPAAPEYPRRLASLGAAMHHRWDGQGRSADRDAAEVAFRAAEACLADPVSVAADAVWQVGADLGAHSLYRYRAGGGVDDLDTALRWLRPAAEADGYRSARLLNNLGAALRLRYEAGGRPEDLDEAVDLLRRSLANASTLRRPAYLRDFANALLDRFVRTGVIRDLDDAVRLTAEATQRYPARSPERAGALNDHANILRTRFTYTRTAADLTEARHALIDALALSPAGSPDRYVYLDNLANVLVDEFTMTGDRQRLREAVARFDEALLMVPESSERIRLLANRAGALWHLWQVSADEYDLQLAVAAFDEAARGTPPGTPARAMRLNNLAVALLDRYARRPDPADAQAARAALDEATAPGPGGDVLWALRAARAWGRWAAAHGHADDAALAYGRAHAAMLELLIWQSGRRHKEQWLREAAGIAVEASHASHVLERPREAVVRLELGRALLLSEALRPVEQVLAALARADHNDLVDRFRGVMAAATQSGADQ